LPCQLNNRLPINERHKVVCFNQRLGLRLKRPINGWRDVFCAFYFDRDYLEPELAGLPYCLVDRWLRSRVQRVEKHGNAYRFGDEFLEHLHPLCRDLEIVVDNPSEIASGTGDAVYDSEINRVAPDHGEDNRD